MSEAIEWDVVVVGAGAAGIAAARSAHEAGARVLLANHGTGASALTAGWVAPGNGELAEEAFAWLPGVGLRPMGAYAFGTTSGAMVGALSGLASLLDLTELPEGALGVVDLVAGPGWSAELVARALEGGVDREVRVVRGGDAAPRGETSAEVARAFDTIGLLEGFAERLAPAIAGCASLLFPPVLGFARDDVAERLSQRLGVVVGETGGSTGDGTAARLARALAAGVPADVARVEGRATVKVFGEGGRGPVEVTVDGRAVRARAAILATGGLMAGGLVFDGVFSEPCAGAPVWIRPHGRQSMIPTVKNAERGMDPQPLFTPDPTGETEAMAAGLRVTRDMRVVGGDGHEPFAMALFGAGSVLTGGSAPYGRALAEALTSGHIAGRQAATFARAGR